MNTHGKHCQCVCVETTTCVLRLKRHEHQDKLLFTVAIVNDCVTKFCSTTPRHSLRQEEAARRRTYKRRHVWCTVSPGSTCTQGDQVEEGCWPKHINTSPSRRVQRTHNDATTQAPRTHRVGALSRCHPGHRARHPPYTRDRYAGEAVGGSTYTARTGARLAPNHNTKNYLF